MILSPRRSDLERRVCHFARELRSWKESCRFRKSWVPGDLSGERLGHPEGPWTSEGAWKWTSWAQRAWSEARLGLQGACRQGILGPRGLLGERFERHKAAWGLRRLGRRGLPGRKVADPRNCQRLQGSAQAALCPRIPNAHKRSVEICL